VEEQPFDRFFKKPEADTHYHEEIKPQQKDPVPQKVILPEEKKREYSPPQERKTEYIPKEDYIPKRSVHVTMPGNMTREQKKEIEKETPPSAPAPVISITEAPQAEIKYSQPLDDIKEMYVNNLLERKRKSAKKKFISKTLKRASIFIVLIGAGVLAGFVLKSKNKKEPVALNKEISQPQQTISDPQEIITTSELTEETTNDNSEFTEESNVQLQNYNNKPKETIQLEELPKTVPVKEITPKETKPVIDENQNSPGADINLATGERNKKERTDNTVEEQTEMKTEIKQDNSPKLASVKSNNYERGAFGGIRNLELTVTNQSKYLLDKVIVELQYLKPSEEPLKSEKIVFRSIPVDGTSTIAVPPTNRGIKVAYKIIKVESKEFNDETAGM
jgi:hypothetical protein